MPDTLGAAVCATAIWLMFAVAIVFDVPKAPRSELWAPTLFREVQARATARARARARCCRTAQRLTVPQLRSVLRALVATACASAGLCISQPVPVFAHDIYSQLTSKSGRRCCDGSDCRPAQYRVKTSGIEMLVQRRWVHIPSGSVQYRAIAGDTGETSGGHWCGEAY